MEVDKKVVKVLSKSLSNTSHKNRHHLIQRSFTRIRYENKITSHNQKV